MKRFGIFSEVDIFCYLLSEGLTARRGSIVACAQSGHPVVVTGPAESDEFDHHPRFKALIARGAIVLSRGRCIDDEAYANPHRVGTETCRQSARAVRFRRLVEGCHPGDPGSVHSVMRKRAI